MLVAVSAFVPISGHPRSEEEYERLAEPLYDLAMEVPMLLAKQELEACWLYKYLHDVHGDVPRHSVADNPKKNTLAYHIVQAQKTEFLLSAAAACDMRPSVYVWIDYGIFHIPGVTVPVVRDFLKRAADEKTITIPGCWDSDYTYRDDQPCWRFCGGVMVVPREYVVEFDAAMKREYVRWLELHNKVTWEVNTLARVEQLTSLPIWWYKADHDSSIFTNYRAAECADSHV